MVLESGYEKLGTVFPMKPLGGSVEKKPTMIRGQFFTRETEVLTPSGWVSVADLGDSMLMQVNQNLEGEFIKPLEYETRSYHGDLVRYERKLHKMLASPDTEIVFTEGSRLLKQRLQDMPNSINGLIPTAITYKWGTGTGFTEDQLSLIVAVMADGNITNRKTMVFDGEKYIPNRYITFNFKKVRKVNRLLGVLDALGIPCSYNEHSNGVYSIYFTAPTWLLGKTFPVSWITDMTLEERQFFISEVVQWDGNPSKAGHEEFYSQFYDECSFVQIIAETCGMHASICEQKKTKGTMFTTNIFPDRDCVSWTDSHSNMEYEKYTGDVSCLRVPSGNLLIRYMGKITVVGDCSDMVLQKSQLQRDRNDMARWISTEDPLEFDMLEALAIMDCRAMLDSNNIFKRKNL